MQHKEYHKKILLLTGFSARKLQVDHTFGVHPDGLTNKNHLIEDNLDRFKRKYWSVAFINVNNQALGFYPKNYKL